MAGSDLRMIRARNADGTYMGDDPSTADINEAWVVVNDTNGDPE
jgi:hypothetical protein